MAQSKGMVYLLLVRQTGSFLNFVFIFSSYANVYSHRISFKFLICRPEVMDRAVLRPGRFGKLLYVPLPSPDERGLILKALARKKPIDDGVDLGAIGRMEACENLSGADLAALVCNCYFSL